MDYLTVDGADSINKHIQDLATLHPANCHLITLPNQSAETRTSLALRLGAGSAGSRDCVVMIGAQHADEWGSTEILLNFATEMLSNFEANTGVSFGGKAFSAAQIQTMMSSLHIIVFPLVNPDGRRFSQDDAAAGGTGAWRKNRHLDEAQKALNQAGCLGIDPNRNYDFVWDFKKNFDPGLNFIDDQPCVDIYFGAAPFSEAESRNVKFLLDDNPRTRWFIDLHSGSLNIRTSWGDAPSQSTDPSMNFRNVAYDGQRGAPGGPYEEYFPAGDLAVETQLAKQLADAMAAANPALPQFPFGEDVVVGATITHATAKDYAYSRHFVDPSKGKIYGFTIEWSLDKRPLWADMVPIVQQVTAGLIEFCVQAPIGGGLTAVGLLTPALAFHNVPQDVEVSRAAIFSVQSTAPVNLQVNPLPSVDMGPGAFTLPLGASGTLPAAATAEERDVKIWVSFKGQAPSTQTSGTMTVHCQQTNQDFVIPIIANSVAPPVVASVLTLDRSGSMDDPSGIPGNTHMDVLHAAAPKFVALLPDTDSIGIVSFDQDAHPVLDLTLSDAAGRAAAVAKIAAHATNPNGMTAIGDGVEMAHQKLAGASGSKAIVVFTDGKDTASKTVDDVIAAGEIDDRVFAIGLGDVNTVDPVALNKLTDGNDGYLLVTDLLDSSDQFLLSKHFIQILAGVTNAEIVVDPQGHLPPGAEARIPFDLTEADYGADAILLSPAPWAIDFALETPDGVAIRHAALAGTSGVQFTHGPEMDFYRLNLPVLAAGAQTRPGRWHVMLRVPQDRWHEYLIWLRKNTKRAPPGADALGVPWCVNIHARSNLHMKVALTQVSYQPGAELRLRAVLREVSLPVEHRAHVRAAVTRPDGTHAVILLAEIEPGVFEASTVAPISGVYPVRFRAVGKTLRGAPFSREAVRTGVVWRDRGRGSTAPAPTKPGRRTSAGS